MDIYRHSGNFPSGVTGNEPEITGKSPEQKLDKVIHFNHNNQFPMRFIANATLVEDNGIGGGQRYQLDRRTYEPNPTSDTVTLCGINLSPRLNVGDSGIIVYISEPSRGLMWFWKDWTEEQFIEEYGQG